MQGVRLRVWEGGVNEGGKEKLGREEDMGGKPGREAVIENVIEKASQTSIAEAIIASPPRVRSAEVMQFWKDLLQPIASVMLSSEELKRAVTVPS